MKTQMNFRLTAKAKSLLWQLSNHLGINQTAVVELAIRELAKQEAVDTDAPKKGGSS